MMLLCYTRLTTVSAYAAESDTGVEITIANFPQLANVLKTSLYDSNQDGWLSPDEISSIQRLYVDGSISNVTGITYLTNLTELVIDRYTGSTLDIDKENQSLETLLVEPSASTFTVNAPYVKTIIIAPVSIICETYNGKSVAEYSSDGGMTTGTKSINIAKCSNMTGLKLSIKSVTALSLPKSNNSSLTSLDIEYSNLPSINLASSPKLKYLSLNTCSKLSKLSTAANKNLIYVSIDFCPKLSSLSFTNNTKLQYFYILAINNVKSVNLTKCTKIKRVLSYPMEGTIKLSMPSGKKSKLITYSSSNIDTFFNAQSAMTTAVIDYCVPYYSSYKIFTTSETNDDYYNKKIVEITKANFGNLYTAVKSNDWNEDGWLSQSEIDGIQYITLTGTTSNLTGLKYLTNLNSLSIEKYTGSSLTINNRWLNHLNLQQITKSTFTLKAPYLKSLRIVANSTVKKLNLSGCTQTVALCVRNENNYTEGLSSLSLPKSGTNMRLLYLCDLNISSVKLTSYTNLEYLGILSCPKIKSINVTKNTKLRGIQLSCSAVSKFDLTKNTKLEQYFVKGKSGFKLTKPSGISSDSSVYNSWIYEVNNSVWGSSCAY